MVFANGVPAIIVRIMSRKDRRSDDQARGPAHLYGMCVRDPALIRAVRMPDEASEPTPSTIGKGRLARFRQRDEILHVLDRYRRMRDENT